MTTKSRYYPDWHSIWTTAGIGAADEALFEMAMPLFESDDVGQALPGHINAKNFPRLAAVTGRAMKIDAFAFTLTHP